VGARLSWHPAAVGVLRREARDPGLHGVLAVGAISRRERGVGDDGADAGAEHAAVLVGAQPAAWARAAGAADLPAGAGGGSRLLGGDAPPARGERRRADARVDPARPRHAGDARPLPGAAGISLAADAGGGGPVAAGQPPAAARRR